MRRRAEAETTEIPTTEPFKVHATQLLAPHALNPSCYNPRKISIEKFQALKDNIREEGFIEPIAVQKKGLGIIGGHQRVKAVKEICVELGMAVPEIPCIVLDIDDRRAKKLNIKLNNLKGDFEARMLGELLVDLYEDEPINVQEAEALGFTLEEATKFIHIIEPSLGKVPGETDPIPSFGRLPTLSLEFADAAMRDRVKKLLGERTVLEEKKSGDVVAEALGFGKKAKPLKKRRAA